MSAISPAKGFCSLSNGARASGKGTGSAWIAASACMMGTKWRGSLAGVPTISSTSSAPRGMPAEGAITLCSNGTCPDGAAR
ncbi:hypothetical protein D9M68_887230 [compost metagenome]